MSIKIGAIVQARMTSQRLPNKVLLEIAGKPTLQYLIERLEHCDCLDNIVIATSTDDSDTPIAEFCRRNNTACYRGPLSDVAGRFSEAADNYRFDAFVRITGDSPLLDQRLVEKAVSIYRGEDVDLVTNAFPRSYPIGQTVEVLDAATFKRTWQRMREEADREHVVRYYYQHPEEFRIRNFSREENLSQLQLSVDTGQDMQNFVTIISKMTRSHWEYTLEEVLQIYRGLTLSETEKL